MANFKRKTLDLSTGKQVKLYGKSIAIGKTLGLGEGYASNIFSVSQEAGSKKIRSPGYQSTQINGGRADGDCRLQYPVVDGIKG